MKLLAASLALVFPLCNAAALRTVGHDRRELQGGSLAAVELINSANGSLVRALANGDVIDISTIAGMTTPTFNINASVSADVKSVKFGHNGNDGYRVENNALFAFCGNKGPVFNACSDLGLGQHTVTVSTFAVTAAAGQALSSITVTFTIVNGANGGPAPVSGPVPIPTSAPIAAPMPAPVPVPVPVPVAVPVPTMPNTNCKVPKVCSSDCEIDGLIDGILTLAYSFLALLSAVGRFMEQR
jgi:hypothetical protein